MKLCIIISGILSISLGYAAKMPDFIPACPRNLGGSQLNECGLKNAQISISGIVNGSRAYGIPNMTPLHIPRIDIQAGSNLNILLLDNAVSGLEGTIVNAVNINLKEQHMQFNVTIPIANIIGNYKMNGHILILPISGDGAANITFVGGNYLYNMDYILKRRHNKDYLEIMDHNITFTTERAYYYFQNLFNGDSQLGPDMNKFLNENWADVTKDLGSTVAETISSIITSLAMSLFVKLPLEEVFPLA